MSKKELAITCDTQLRIPWQELHGIQGALKMLTKENFTKLRRHILDDGVNFALHVWKEVAQTPGKKKVIKWWIIDGHGRHAVIKYLVTEESYSCGPLPCVEIQAKSFKDAKRKVLNASSSFHSTTKEGLYEFMTDLGLGIDALDQFELPEIDIPEFRMEFFDDPAAQDEGGEKKNVNFDAYQNAAIKQVVLYFAKDDYEKVISAFDTLTDKWQLEDHSQVVWRLLREAVPA